MLVVAVAEEPDQLVPPFARSRASAAIWPWILPALVRVEAESLGAGRVGDLALSWEIEDGGRAVRFYLDSGRMWEDTTSVGAGRRHELSALPRSHHRRRLAFASSMRSPRSSPRRRAGDRSSSVSAGPSRARALQLAALPVIEAEQYEKTKDRIPRSASRGAPSTRRDRSVSRSGSKASRSGSRVTRSPEGRVPRAEQLMLRFVPSGRSRAAQLEAGIADLAIDLPGEALAMLRDESPEVRLVRAGGCAAEAILLEPRSSDLGWSRDPAGAPRPARLWSHPTGCGRRFGTVARRAVQWIAGRRYECGRRAHRFLAGTGRISRRGAPPPGVDCHRQRRGAARKRARGPREHRRAARTARRLIR